MPPARARRWGSGGAPLLPPVAELEETVRRALREDIGSGDATTEAIVPVEALAKGLIVQKAAGSVYGLQMAELTFLALDRDARFERLVPEGYWRAEGGPVLAVEGRARALLTAERTALNFLGHLSGVASFAARAASATSGTGAKVLDTRKTTPGLRALEKAAVAAGGGYNHRFGLYDAILIKDNHIAIAGSIARAVELARAAHPDLAGTLEVEVRTLEEIDEAIAAGAPRLLLDNMDVYELRAAVTRVASRAETEASGNVTLDTLRELAETGIDWISMGALTHSSRALDLSMSLEVLP
ncbi:MAG TPA: carboxylating nicotinate-nucleotide diphosphorylase [Solirubrobacteraceae bacterium]|nr:carboxylating nicotinate-nucleotide diphosphorylase [Solirubrobacteraceae bacterium]